MAGSLYKINQIDASDDATISFSSPKINDDFSVYVIKFNDVTPTITDKQLYFRFMIDGTPLTSLYYYTFVAMSSDSGFINVNNSNTAFSQVTNYANGTGNSQTAQGTLNLFGLRNPDTYNFAIHKTSNMTSSNSFRGLVGSTLHKTAQQVNGIQFYYNSGNIAEGQFTLYGYRE